MIAETLFGEHNPGGKLTVTFPKSVGQIELNFPFKPGSHGAQPHSGPNGSGATRVIGELYPFGFGLSYTTFAYSIWKSLRCNSIRRANIRLKSTLRILENVRVTRWCNCMYAIR